MEPETSAEYSARIARGDRLAFAAIRCACALVPMIGAVAIFPWAETFGPYQADRYTPSTFKAAGTRFDDKEAGGAIANATALIHVDMERVQSFVLFGIAVLIAAPRRS